MQLEMRGVNYDLDDELKDHIERRLRSALGRFAARIDRLTVRLSDVNGPAGGSTSGAGSPSPWSPGAW